MIKYNEINGSRDNNVIIQRIFKIVEEVSKIEYFFIFFLI